MTATLKEKYNKEIVPHLCETNKYRNRMMAPKITKIVVNMGLSATVDKDDFKRATEELAVITGQKPLETKARVSISNFRLREGMSVGAKVTLRGDRMYEFLDRLINMTLPRIRDFRGISAKSFDGRGNYSLGIKEQTIFPEINPDKVKRTQGMDITIVTSTDNDDEARELLRQFGMPFMNE